MITPTTQENIVKNPDGTKTITLPSGAVVVMRKGKGKDILRASNMIRAGVDPQMRMLFALIAVKSKIQHPGGDSFAELTVEDVDEMDDEDVFTLLGASSSGKLLAPST